LYNKFEYTESYLLESKSINHS